MISPALINLLTTIYDELNVDGQWPDHCHDTPGIWDSDMGVLANQPCELCATWAKFGVVVQSMRPDATEQFTP